MPAPFARQLLTEDMLTKRTPEAHAWAVHEFRKFRSEGQFVPFGVESPPCFSRVTTAARSGEALR